MDATFNANGITFSQYPFPPASIYPRGTLAYADIRDVDPNAAPPEVRTKTGETLFISATYQDEFHAAIAHANLTVVRRVDVWGLLLEPYLDTEFSADHQERVMDELASLGITRAEVSRIRKDVGGAVLAYNSLHWEWVHLGLCDVLTALRQGISWTAVKYRLSPKRYEAFYWAAMALAERGRNGHSDSAGERGG